MTLELPPKALPVLAPAPSWGDEFSTMERWDLCGRGD